MPPPSSNPLKTDPQLKKLLEESKGIESTQDFDGWRKSFLNRLDDILRDGSDGAEKASQSYKEFSASMGEFAKKVFSLQSCIAQGTLSSTRVAVRGRNAMNEVKEAATQAVISLIQWMPSVSQEEEALGYSKWQLGAVLVRDGFEIYETMTLCRDELHQARKDCLDAVADRQTLDAIDYYGRQIVRFCDVMADLGLYDLMMHSHETRSDDWRKKKKRTLSGSDLIPYDRDKDPSLPKARSAKNNKIQNGNNEKGTQKHDDGEEENSFADAKDLGNGDLYSSDTENDDDRNDTAKKEDSEEEDAENNDANDSNEQGGEGGPRRPHLRLQIGSASERKYTRKIRHDDCIMVAEMFGEEEDTSNYFNLIEEITKLQQKGVPNANWALSEDGSHLVCENARTSRTVENITSRICKYFQIRKDSVLLKIEMYRDGGDTKPASHDMIAYKGQDPAKLRNIVVHASFGVERELSLETADESSVAVYVPQRNNSVFTVGQDVNIRFENSVIQADNSCKKGRVCIRLYGLAENIVEEEGSLELLE